MKLLIFIISYTMILSLLSCSSTPPKSQWHLYQVTKNGISSYFFGTIHTGVSLSDISTDVIRILGSTSILYSELSLKESYEDIANINQLRKHKKQQKQDAYCLALDSASDNLPDVQINRKLIEIGLPKDAKMCSSFTNDVSIIGRVKRALFIYQNDNPKTGLDSQINIHMAKRNVAIRRIESLSFLNKVDELQKKHLKEKGLINYDEVKQNFKYTLEDIDFIVKELQSIVRKYFKGTVDMTFDFEGRDYSLKLRNYHWKKTLISVMDKQPVSVSVGVAHLYGAHGLIKIFQREGYGVQRYPFKRKQKGTNTLKVQTL